MIVGQRWMLSVPASDIISPLQLASWDQQFSWGDESPGAFFLSLALQRWITMRMSLMQHCRREGSFSTPSLRLFAAGLLLIWPLLPVYATYTDLTVELCKEHKDQKCVRYIPPPNLKNIKFTWEM